MADLFSILNYIIPKQSFGTTYINLDETSDAWANALDKRINDGLETLPSTDKKALSYFWRLKRQSYIDLSNAISSNKTIQSNFISGATYTTNRINQVLNAQPQWEKISDMMSGTINGSILNFDIETIGDVTYEKMHRTHIDNISNIDPLSAITEFGFSVTDFEDGIKKNSGKITLMSGLSKEQSSALQKVISKASEKGFDSLTEAEQRTLLHISTFRNSDAFISISDSAELKAIGSRLFTDDTLKVLNNIAEESSSISDIQKGAKALIELGKEQKFTDVFEYVNDLLKTYIDDTHKVLEIANSGFESTALNNQIERFYGKSNKKFINGSKIYSNAIDPISANSLIAYANGVSANDVVSNTPILNGQMIKHANIPNSVQGEIEALGLTMAEKHHGGEDAFMQGEFVTNRAYYNGKSFVDNVTESIEKIKLKRNNEKTRRKTRLFVNSDFNSTEFDIIMEKIDNDGNVEYTKGISSLRGQALELDKKASGYSEVKPFTDSKVKSDSKTMYAAVFTDQIKTTDGKTIRYKKLFNSEQEFIKWQETNTTPTNDMTQTQIERQKQLYAEDNARREYDKFFDVSEVSQINAQYNPAEIERYNLPQQAELLKRQTSSTGFEGLIRKYDLITDIQTKFNIDIDQVSSFIKDNKDNADLIDVFSSYGLTSKSQIDSFEVLSSKLIDEKYMFEDIYDYITKIENFNNVKYNNMQKTYIASNLRTLIEDEVSKTGATKASIKKSRYDHTSDTYGIDIFTGIDEKNNKIYKRIVSRNDNVDNISSQLTRIFKDKTNDEIIDSIIDLQQRSIISEAQSDKLISELRNNHILGSERYSTIFNKLGIELNSVMSPLYDKNIKGKVKPHALLSRIQKDTETTLPEEQIIALQNKIVTDSLGSSIDDKMHSRYTVKGKKKPVSISEIIKENNITIDGLYSSQNDAIDNIFKRADSINHVMFSFDGSYSEKIKQQLNEFALSLGYSEKQATAFANFFDAYEVKNGAAKYKKYALRNPEYKDIRTFLIGPSKNNENGYMIFTNTQDMSTVYEDLLNGNVDLSSTKKIQDRFKGKASVLEVKSINSVSVGNIFNLNLVDRGNKEEIYNLREMFNIDEKGTINTTIVKQGSQEVFPIGSINVYTNKYGKLSASITRPGDEMYKILQLSGGSAFKKISEGDYEGANSIFTKQIAERLENFSSPSSTRGYVINGVNVRASNYNHNDLAHAFQIDLSNIGKILEDEIRTSFSTAPEGELPDILKFAKAIAEYDGTYRPIIGNREIPFEFGHAVSALNSKSFQEFYHKYLFSGKLKDDIRFKDNKFGLSKKALEGDIMSLILRESERMQDSSSIYDKSLAEILKIINNSKKYFSQSVLNEHNTSNNIYTILPEGRIMAKSNNQSALRPTYGQIGNGMLFSSQELSEIIDTTEKTSINTKGTKIGGTIISHVQEEFFSNVKDNTDFSRKVRDITGNIETYGKNTSIISTPIKQLTDLELQNYYRTVDNNMESFRERIIKTLEDKGVISSNLSSKETKKINSRINFLYKHFKDNYASLHEGKIFGAPTLFNTSAFTSPNLEKFDFLGLQGESYVYELLNKKLFSNKAFIEVNNGDTIANIIKILDKEKKRLIKNNASSDEIEKVSKAIVQWSNANDDVIKYFGSRAKFTKQNLQELYESGKTYVSPIINPVDDIKLTLGQEKATSHTINIIEFFNKNKDKLSKKHGYNIQNPEDLLPYFEAMFKDMVNLGETTEDLLQPTIVGFFKHDKHGLMSSSTLNIISQEFLNSGDKQIIQAFMDLMNNSDIINQENVPFNFRLSKNQKAYVYDTFTTSSKDNLLTNATNRLYTVFTSDNYEDIYKIFGDDLSDKTKEVIKSASDKLKYAIQNGIIVEDVQRMNVNEKMGELIYSDARFAQMARLRGIESTINLYSEDKDSVRGIKPGVNGEIFITENGKRRKLTPNEVIEYKQKGYTDFEALSYDSIVQSKLEDEMLNYNHHKKYKYGDISIFDTISNEQVLNMNDKTSSFLKQRKRTQKILEGLQNTYDYYLEAKKMFEHGLAENGTVSARDIKIPIDGNMINMFTEENSIFVPINKINVDEMSAGGKWSNGIFLRDGKPTDFIMSLLNDREENIKNIRNIVLTDANIQIEDGVLLKDVVIPLHNLVGEDNPMRDNSFSATLKFLNAYSNNPETRESSFLNMLNDYKKQFNVYDKDSLAAKVTQKFPIQHSAQALARDEVAPLVEAVYSVQNTGTSIKNIVEEMRKIEKEAIVSKGEIPLEVIERYKTLDHQFKYYLSNVGEDIIKHPTKENITLLGNESSRAIHHGYEIINGKVYMSNAYEVSQEMFKTMGLDTKVVGYQLFNDLATNGSLKKYETNEVFDAFINDERTRKKLIKKLNQATGLNKPVFSENATYKEIFDTLSDTKEFGKLLNIKDLNESIKNKKTPKVIGRLFDSFSFISERYLQDVGIIGGVARYPFFSSQPTTRIYLNPNINGNQIRALTPLASLYTNVDYDGDIEAAYTYLKGTGIKTLNELEEEMKAYKLSTINNNENFARLLVDNADGFFRDLNEDPILANAWQINKFSPDIIDSDIHSISIERNGVSTKYSGNLVSLWQEEMFGTQSPGGEQVLPTKKFKELTPIEKISFSHYAFEKGYFNEYNNESLLKNHNVMSAIIAARVRKESIGAISKPSFILRDAILMVQSGGQFNGQKLSDEEFKTLTYFINDLTSLSKDSLMDVLEQKGIDVKHVSDAIDSSNADKWFKGLDNLFYRTNDDWRKRKGLENIIEAAYDSALKGFDISTKDRSSTKVLADIIEKNSSERYFIMSTYLSEGYDAVKSHYKKSSDETISRMIQLSLESTHVIDSKNKEILEKVFGKDYKNHKNMSNTINSLLGIGIIEEASEKFRGRISSHEEATKAIKALEDAYTFGKYSKQIKSMYEISKTRYIQDAYTQAINIIGRKYGVKDIDKFIYDVNQINNTEVYAENLEGILIAAKKMFHKRKSDTPLIMNKNTIYIKNAYENLNGTEYSIDNTGIGEYRISVDKSGNIISNNQITLYSENSSDKIIIETKDKTKKQINEEFMQIFGNKNGELQTFDGTIYDYLNTIKENPSIRPEELKKRRNINLLTQVAFNDNPVNNKTTAENLYDYLINNKNSQITHMNQQYTYEANEQIAKIIGGLNDKQKFIRDMEEVNDIVSTLNYMSINSKYSQRFDSRTLEQKNGIRALVKDLNESIIENGGITNSGTSFSMPEFYKQELIKKGIFKDARDYDLLKIETERFGTFYKTEYNNFINTIDNIRSQSIDLYDIMNDENRLLYSDTQKAIDVLSDFYKSENMPIPEDIQKIVSEHIDIDNITDEVNKLNSEYLSKIRKDNETLIYNMFTDKTTNNRVEQVMDSIFEWSNTPSNKSIVGFGEYLGMRFEELSKADIETIIEVGKKANLDNASVAQKHAYQTTTKLLEDYIKTVPDDRVSAKKVTTRMLESVDNHMKDMEAVLKTHEKDIQLSAKRFEQERNKMQSKHLKEQVSEILTNSGINKQTIGTAIGVAAALGLAGNLLHAVTSKKHSPLVPQHDEGENDTQGYYANESRKSSNMSSEMQPKIPSEEKKIYANSGTQFNFKVTAKTAKYLENQNIPGIVAKSGGGNAKIYVNKDTSKISNNWLENKFAELI